MKEKQSQELIFDVSSRGYTVIDNWLFDTDLTIYEKIVYIVLKRAAGQANRAYPRVVTIARQAAVSTRTVQRALRGLSKKRLIHCLKDQPGRPNIYFLLDPSTAKFIRSIPMTNSHLPMTNSHPPSSIKTNLIKTNLHTPEECVLDQKYGKEKVALALDVIDFQYPDRSKIKNLQGLLIKMLSNGIITPNGYLPPEERRKREEAKKEKEREETRKEKEQKEREEKWSNEAAMKFKSLSISDQEKLREKAINELPAILRNMEDKEFAVRSQIYKILMGGGS